MADRTRAEAVLAEVRQRLRERHGDLVEQVFWYGAVHLDPALLTVWVLLRGEPAALPEWHFPDRDPRPEGLAEDLLDRVAEIRAEVAAVLGREWPVTGRELIGFDSVERVRLGGGYLYFKG